MQGHPYSSEKNIKDMNFAMRLSFFAGIFMFLIKGYAFYLTGSAAIFSDAAESVIHIFAVGFAAYSMWLSMRPADENHLYGHDKITFFSAGFEGAMIIIAAFVIVYEALHKLFFGFEITNLDDGIIFIMIATVINYALSLYLIRKGKKYNSLILEANGKHIFTDCATSFGVIVALILVKFTSLIYLDPIIAILIAMNILYTGGTLIRKSIRGLMDETDPEFHEQLITLIQKETTERGLFFHNLKHRISGYTIFIQFHLLFPNDLTLKEAHDIACTIESEIKKKWDIPVEISTHLEPQKEHDIIHKKYGLKI